jgi:hypothetical protein
MLSVALFMLVLFLTRLLAGGLEQTGLPAMQPLLLQLLLLVVFFSICAVAGPYRNTDALLTVGRRGDGSAARARADFADELANHGGDNDECNPFRTGEVWLAAIRIRWRKHVTAQCTPSR